ncbi:capsular biosynthesis protein [Alsobacter soli]|uniref:Capsular biosynthesis protein n=1 Tax=Alsobacter soli TaxID=2109933 RepID=A0A2T1HNV3_9HYPH|nr:nucleoside-diphosphate sugar epimerase/dehydratase [Alsobacter soli]PSC03338.1 capsular biosynthesis protein [Alsobacter soli]
MSLLRRFDHKKALVVAHDVFMTACALAAVFLLRFEGPLLTARLRYLPALIPAFAAYASLVYWYFGLYKSRWRFASLPDLSGIVKAVTVLSLSLLVLDYGLVSPDFYGGFFFGKVTIVLYWMIQIFFLGGPRVAYRYSRFVRSREQAEKLATTPALVLGRPQDVEIVLRAMESGGLRRIHAVGALSPRASDAGQSIRGVSLKAGSGQLEKLVADLAERGVSVKRLIATPSALAAEAEPEQLFAAARRLGIPLTRFQTLDEGLGGGASLAPVEIDDLLLRPSVRIDRDRLRGLVEGRRVVVTGGGGSIGSEMALRVAAFGAAELMIVESSEPALHAITEAFALQASPTRLTGVIADIRDRARIHRLFARFRPDLVFHAAALKHVPYLEQDWDEAIKTNVFGSVNVLDAAVASGASAAVMISTDKAIEPVSMLGATKRFAEMYAQALDAEAASAKPNGAVRTRLIAVRFGNVLGSNGSVVPKFKSQIAHGGPVTVTHPDMVRYFMTVREAAELVLTAASHADVDMRQPQASAAETPSVYVLKMGQPVKIMTLAERMIRLAGFEPGVDIEIAVTGARPGERLNEILFDQAEPTVDTGVEGVMAAKPLFADMARIQEWLAQLRAALESEDRDAGRHILAEAVPAFTRAVIPPPAIAEPPPASTQPEVASRG